MLENDRLACTASGRPPFLGPTLLHVGQFKDLWNLIADGERETHLVYISPRFEPGSDEASFAVDPERVAAALGPSAFYPLFASHDAGDYAKKFNARSIFELKRGAGKMTRKDSRLMAQYQDTYQGRAINAEAHLAKGNDDASPNSLRLYFAFDEETDRIIVSHIGKHLDNYSTRYLK